LGRDESRNAEPLARKPLKKKRGVPRHHRIMLPGNSFPQICVVSVKEYVENRYYMTRVRKDHGF
jgi:hypothetical protein